MSKAEKDTDVLIRILGKDYNELEKRAKEDFRTLEQELAFAIHQFLDKTQKYVWSIPSVWEKWDKNTTPSPTEPKKRWDGGWEITC